MRGGGVEFSQKYSAYLEGVKDKMPDAILRKYLEKHMLPETMSFYLGANNRKTQTKPALTS